MTDLALMVANFVWAGWCALQAAASTGFEGLAFAYLAVGNLVLGCVLLSLWLEQRGERR